MNVEKFPSPVTRLETLKTTLQHSPEKFDDLDASMYFLEADPIDFKQAMLDLGKSGRTFSFVFSLDDASFGTTDNEKRDHLRQLKAILDDPRLKNIVTKITVKGRPGDEQLEPNVFSSDVEFVLIEP